MALIGLGDDPDLATFEGRVANRGRIDARMASWIGERSQDQVLDAFEQAEAAAAPVYDMADIIDDPHLDARGALVEVDGTTMQGLIARLSATPGSVRHVGRPLDADGPAIRADGWSGPRGGAGATADRPRREPGGKLGTGRSGV
jgi:crotonobetainyl-CoA:carnitine CoA-transferase CaiB-like acyl-CoA transferase